MSNNKLPFISICIPTYNKVSYVQRLLNSIKEQSFKNFEVLIADNSEENEIEILAATYKNDFPNLYYKKNIPAVGMAENHNEATKMANGEWVKIMHSDDWFTNAESLQMFADAALIHYECNFIFAGCNEITLDKFTSQQHLPNNEQVALLQNNVYSLFNNNIIGHPSTMMHKNTRDIFYDNNFKWVVDVDFYIRYLNKYNNFYFIDRSLINIGIDSLQESASCYKNPSVEIPEYFNLLVKHSVEKLSVLEVFNSFWNIIKKFSIKSPDQIRSAGYLQNIPIAIGYIIDFQKNIPRILIKQTPVSNFLMKKCFNQLKQKGII